MPKTNRKVNRPEPATRRSGNNTLAHPPQLRSAFLTRHKFRFQATEAFVSNITTGQIMNLVVTSAGLGTSPALLSMITPVMNSVRIRSVELWAANTSAATPVTVELNWSLNTVRFSAPADARTDTALGVTDVAHIKCVPPRNSFAAMWMNATTTQSSPSTANPALFDLNIPSGTIIDLDLDLCFGGNGAIDLSTLEFSSGTVEFNGLYCNCLDTTLTPTPTTGVLVPVGWPTITY